MLVAGKSIFVEARFCGPPTSGNGGYACGLLAAALPDSATVECTIRRPIPLDRELNIELRDQHAVLLDGDNVVIEAMPADYSFPYPAPIALDVAARAVQKSPAFTNHPFPTCFVCGPDRPHHDGLNIFPGAVAAGEAPAEQFHNLYAALWRPAREFAGASGNLLPEFIWAAMDCPTGFAAGFPYDGKLVTGRLGVKLLAPVTPAADCVLMSWSLGNQGRKCHAAAVLYQNQIACAIARATWIKLA